MYLLGRPCPESEKSSSQKYGLAIVDVETLVFHHKDLWITLWLECVDEGGVVNDVLASVRCRAASGCEETPYCGYMRSRKMNFKHVGKRHIFAVRQTW